MRIGFIGTGNIGAPMAANILKAGMELVVHDIRRDKAAPLVDQGAAWADSPAEVAAQCDITCACLPGPAEMEPVSIRPGGILDGARPGMIYIDHTTNSPLLAQRVHGVLAERGVDMLDAPVSGGPDGARSGRLAIWVVGDREAFERVKPALDSMGDQPYYVGPIGAGAVAKLVHNCAGYIIQAGLAEVFTMGVKAGVDPLGLWLAVRQGAQGRRGAFERLADHFLIDSYDPPDFALRLARKDMDLACQVGRQYDVPMKLANIALAEMTEALNRGWGERDSRVAMTLQEERAGVEVNTTPDAIREALGE